MQFFFQNKSKDEYLNLSRYATFQITKILRKKNVQEKTIWAFSFMGCLKKILHTSNHCKTKILDNLLELLYSRVRKNSTFYPLFGLNISVHWVTDHHVNPCRVQYVQRYVSTIGQLDKTVALIFYFVVVISNSLPGLIERSTPFILTFFLNTATNHCTPPPPFSPHLLPSPQWTEKSPH